MFSAAEAGKAVNFFALVFSEYSQPGANKISVHTSHRREHYLLIAVVQLSAFGCVFVDKKIKDMKEKY